MSDEQPKSKTEMALVSQVAEFPDAHDIGKRMLELFSAVTTVVSKLDSYECTNQDQAEIGTGQLANVTQLVKEIDKERVGFVTPFNRVVKTINTGFKLMSEPLAQAKQRVNREITSWRQAERARIDKENREREAKEKALRDKQLADIRAGKAAADRLVAVEREQELDKPTGAQGAHERTIWKYEIMDPDQVPRELCQPAPTLINARVQQAKQSGVGIDTVLIPGIRVYEDTQIVTRTGK